jgi:hypothetical protein
MGSGRITNSSSTCENIRSCQKELTFRFLIISLRINHITKSVWNLTVMKNAKIGIVEKSVNLHIFAIDLGWSARRQKRAKTHSIPVHKQSLEQTK